MSAYLLLGAALLLNAVANLLIKHAAMRGGGLHAGDPGGLAAVTHTYLSIPFVAGVACFGLNLLIYTQALKRIPISVAYPLMVSLGYLIILLVSWFLFEERLTVTRYFGAGLMLAGLWLLVR